MKPLSEEGPCSRTGLLLKKKPVWPFILALPSRAFRLFHVKALIILSEIPTRTASV